MANKDKLLASAQKNLDKGLLQKAINDYQQVVELDPRDVRNRQKLADLLSRGKFNTEAIAQYDIVAKNFCDGGFHLKAIAVYKQIQRLDPTRVDTYQRLAELNVKQGLGGNALTEYRNLLALYEKKGQHPEAAGVLQRLVDLEPENISWRVRMVESYVRGGLKEKALEEAEKSVQQLQGRAQEEMLAKVLDRFLHLFPTSRNLQATFAQGLLRKGEAAKAIQLLKGLVKQDADDPTLLDALAEAYRSEGDFGNERLTLKHRLKNAPDDTALQERMLRCLVACGEQARAVELLAGWAEGFCQAGLTSTLARWSAELLRHLPDEPRLLELAQQARSAGAQGGGSVAADTVLERVAPPGTAAENTDGAEEMSLDFLEGMGDLAGLEAEETFAAPEAASAPPVASVEAPAVVEAPQVPVAETAPTGSVDELELELDLGGELGGFELEQDAPVLTMEAPTASTAVLLSEESLELAGGFELEGLDLAPLDGVELPADANAATEESVQSVPPEAADLGELGGIEELEELAEIEELEELVEVEELEDFSESEGLDGIAEGEEPNQVAAAAAPMERVPYASSDEVATAADFSLEMGSHPGGASADDESRLLAAALESAGIAVAPASAAEPITAGELERDGGAVAETAVASLDLGDLVEELPAGPDLHAELEEAEFFLQQGLFDEAERVCRHILTFDPGNMVAQSRLTEVAQRRSEAAKAPGPQGDFFDLAAEILDDGALKATEDLPGLEDLDRFRFDGVFSEFKKGIESQIDTDDTESHYNLGIAYKEMGLIDDAIAEFDKAKKAPARMVDCLTLKGICLAEKGAFEQAEGVFREGIADPAVADAERISLHYEMGLLYEVWGRPAEAMKCFSAVAVSDHVFRDVEEKLRALREQTAGAEALDERVPAGKSGKDRVSYL